MKGRSRFTSGGVREFLGWEHSGSLVHQLGHLELEYLRKKATTLLAEIETAKDEGSKLDATMAAIGSAYFQGAHAEADQLDLALEQITADRGEFDENKEWLWRLPLVVTSALQYLREYQRDDNAHKARLSKREEVFRDSIFNFAKAWSKRS